MKDRHGKEMSEPHFKLDDIVTLREDAYYKHQLSEWNTPEGKITNRFWESGSFKTGWWYEIKAIPRPGQSMTSSRYRNSYPESDLRIAGMSSNKEAKRLLSKEY
jgi:hypothetical protein